MAFHAAFFRENGIMEIIYQGTDITDYVNVRKCVHRDVSGGRCDALEMELDNAARWISWGPEQDDTILVADRGYSTGKLYLNTILPEDGKYRIIATSLPSTARQRAWASFEVRTLEQIMRECAALCTMDWRLYGIDKEIAYRYMERKNEGCAAFLDRLMRMEGAMLKCYDGRFTAIGILAAQSIQAAQHIELHADQPGVQYKKRDSAKWAALTVVTPYTSVTAQDDSAKTIERRICTQYLAQDAVEAGRWARAMLLEHNRTAEQFTLRTEFNAGMTAMARVDVTGGTDADGAWIVDEAIHDFTNRKTTTKMLRCVTSIQ